MGPGDAARLHHRLTCYTTEREWSAPVDDPLVRQDSVPDEPATLPASCKAYPDGLPVAELPRTRPPFSAPATAVLAGGRRAAPVPARPPWSSCPGRG